MYGSPSSSAQCTSTLFASAGTRYVSQKTWLSPCFQLSTSYASSQPATELVRAHEDRARHAVGVDLGAVVHVGRVGERRTALVGELHLGGGQYLALGVLRVGHDLPGVGLGAEDDLLGHDPVRHHAGVLLELPRGGLAGPHLAAGGRRLCRGGLGLRGGRALRVGLVVPAATGGERESEDGHGRGEAQRGLVVQHNSSCMQMCRSPERFARLWGRRAVQRGRKLPPELSSHHSHVHF